MILKLIIIVGSMVSMCNCIPVENLCIGSLSKRKLRVFQRRDEWEEVSSDRIGCIDLDASGRRWEGGVENGIPFGYGILYDEEGRKEYEGFMVNGCRHYYGSKYYANTNQLKYCGYYCHDKRFGKGTLWKRNESVDYEGEWWNDKPYVRSFWRIFLLFSTFRLERSVSGHILLLD